MKKLFLLSVVLTGLFVFGFNLYAVENNVNQRKVLVVYFSKAGEQYSVGNITKGNTAIIADMIAKKTGADKFEIRVKDDKYPTTYKELIEVATKEKQENARPELIGKVNNFDKYDYVFIGSPNWLSDLPMPVYSFMEKYNWGGKTIAVFMTHEGSGLSSAKDSIMNTTGAYVVDGLAIYGHEVQTGKQNTNEKGATSKKDEVEKNTTSKQNTIQKNITSVKQTEADKGNNSKQEDVEKKIEAWLTKLGF